MKKQTKKLIAAGIVMALSCGVWGSAQATEGINATEGPAINGNEIYADGKIEGFTYGMKAKGKDASNIAKITLDTPSVSINATYKGIYGSPYASFVVGNSDTSEVDIFGKTGAVDLQKGSNALIKGNSITIESDGIAVAVNNKLKSTKSSQLVVNGKKIEIVAGSTAIDARGSESAASLGAVVNLGDEKTDSLSIKSNGVGSTGISANTNTQIIGKAKNITIDSFAKGINASGGDAKDGINTEVTLNAENNVVINATGTLVQGVYSASKAQVNLSGNNVNINAKGTGNQKTNGVLAESKGAVSILGNMATIQSTGGASNNYALSADGNSEIKVKTDKAVVHVDSTTGNAYGVYSNYGSNIELGKDDKSQIQISSSSDTDTAIAVAAASVKAGGSLVAPGINNGTSTTPVTPSDAKPGDVTIKGSMIDVSANGKVARGLYAQDNNTITVGGADSDISIATDGSEDSIGIFAMTGGTIDVNGKNTNITATGDAGAVGIHVQNNTTTATENKSTVNINTENTTINAKTALSAMSQGVLNVNSNLVTNGENAILTRGNSDVNINTDGKHTTQLNGDIVFDYSETTGVDSNVNVNLSGADSSWTGNTKVTWESQSGRPDEEKLEVSGMKLNVANGAQWNPVSIQNSEDQTKGTQEVALNQLHLDNGVVNLDSAKLDEESVVSVQNISGTGTINTNAFDNMMEVKNKEKNTTLTVHGTGAMADEILADTTGEKAKLLAATVVTTNDEIASDKITTDAGVISGAISADVDENGNLSNYTRAVNPSNQAISNMATISLMTWRQENNDMNKRLGELRASQGSQGVWARMARGQAKYGEQSIKNQYNYYQLGYDSKISDDWILGGAFTYTDGESSYTNGSGTNKHTGFAIYGSNLRDDGSFIDIIAKYAHMKNDFDVNGGVEKGDYSTNGYALSAEYGKRFHQDGFWIEPQAELTYGKVSSVDFQTKNGASVHQDSLDSLVGRLGFSLGKDIKQGNVYLRASYLYDFKGETAIQMTGNGVDSGHAPIYKSDIGGSWWEFGVGTNLNLGKDTHFYLDVETTAGGDVDTPWQWNAGVRFSF